MISLTILAVLIPVEPPVVANDFFEISLTLKVESGKFLHRLCSQHHLEQMEAFAQRHDLDVHSKSQNAVRTGFLQTTHIIPALHQMQVLLYQVPFVFFPNF